MSRGLQHQTTGMLKRSTDTRKCKLCDVCCKPAINMKLHKKNLHGKRQKHKFRVKLYNPTAKYYFCPKLDCAFVSRKWKDLKEHSCDKFDIGSVLTGMTDGPDLEDPFQLTEPVTPQKPGIASMGYIKANKRKCVAKRKRRKCKYCAKIYRSQKQLNIHMDICNQIQTATKRNTHFCRLCSGAFGNSDALGQHITQFHYSTVKIADGMKVVSAVRILLKPPTPTIAPEILPVEDTNTVVCKDVVEEHMDCDIFDSVEDSIQYSDDGGIFDGFTTNEYISGGALTEMRHDPEWDIVGNKKAGSSNRLSRKFVEVECGSPCQ